MIENLFQFYSRMFGKVVGDVSNNYVNVDYV